MNFGLWNVAVAASTQLIFYTDALVITAVMPIAAVAWFTIASNVVKQFSSLFIPVGQVFYPAIADLDAKNNRSALKRVYLTGTRLLGVLATSTALVAAIFADDFFRLWIGRRYIEGIGFGSVPLLFRILLVGAAASAVQRIAYQAFIATGRVRLLAILCLCEAILNLVLSLLLVRPLGLVGVALAPSCRHFSFSSSSSHSHSLVRCRSLI